MDTNPESIEMPKTELEVSEFVDKAGLVSGQLGADGAVIFGDGCLILSQVEGEKGKKLKLTIEPGKCGEAMGAQLVKHLMETADSDLAIEIKHTAKPVAEPVVEKK